VEAQFGKDHPGRVEVDSAGRYILGVSFDQGVSSMYATYRTSYAWLSVLLAAGFGVTVLAQQNAEVPSGDPAPPTETSDQGSSPNSAEEVVKRLMSQKRVNPVIEPTRVPGVAQPASSPYDVDPRVLGTAPGTKLPTLRREGKFVIMRRGRVVRAPDGINTLFVFEADSEQAPEPPLILMPCALRQDMEDYIAERGDKVVFVLSGQVFVYRNLNYLLPTMFKFAIDKGNLQQ